MERERWADGGTKDRILNLTELGHCRSALHPQREVIRGPERVFHTGLVEWNSSCWLRSPIAAWEGRGAVCANPGCTGSEPGLP